MSRNDPPQDAEPQNRSSGGIVHGGGIRSAGNTAASVADLAAGIRRRWASGIAVVTAVDAGGGLRGVTVTSQMAVSLEPPVLAVALTASSSFQELATPGAPLGVSVLDATHEFPADRFAGRAPLPDAGFSGIAHRMEQGVPILDKALGWCVGRVRRREGIGDHALILLDVTHGEIGPDTDDPLLTYEGRYRRLEAG